MVRIRFDASCIFMLIYCVGFLTVSQANLEECEVTKDTHWPCLCSKEVCSVLHKCVERKKDSDSTVLKCVACEDSGYISVKWTGQVCIDYLRDRAVVAHRKSLQESATKIKHFQESGRDQPFEEGGGREPDKKTGEKEKHVKKTKDSLETTPIEMVYENKQAVLDDKKENIPASKSACDTLLDFLQGLLGGCC